MMNEMETSDLADIQPGDDRIDDDDDDGDGVGRGDDDGGGDAQ